MHEQRFYIRDSIRICLVDSFLQFQLMWRQMVRVLETQKQIGEHREEAMKAKGDKLRALKDVDEMSTRNTSSRNVNEKSASHKDRTENVEAEAAKARESERKMLESLICQTKQLEQAKISLEEAKLEIECLKENIISLENSHSQNCKMLEKSHSFDVVRSKEEIRALRNELKVAVEAEEKSKMAMDALALALKEVTMEANQAKEKLSEIQSALDAAKAEAKCSKVLHRSAEQKLRQSLEEVRRLKNEVEDSTNTWVEKENGFINFMKMSEEEIENTKQESNRFLDLLRASREKNSRLRDILKQAVNEATIVKEALEIARKENSHLKDTLSEKENALQSIKQEYGCLKVSEAAATRSVKELQSLLTASSNIDSRKPDILTNSESYSEQKQVVSEVKSTKPMTQYPSEHWRPAKSRNNTRRYSMGESGRFEGSLFDMAWSPEKQKSRKSQSFGNFTELKAPPCCPASNVVMTPHSDEFSVIDRSRFDIPDQEDSTLMKLRKKRQIFRRFGEILRRRSFHK